MTELIGTLQDKAKTSSSTVGLLILKGVVALFFGLTFSLIGDQVLQYGWFSFILMLVTFSAVLMRLMKSWSWGHVAVFSLICVLIGISLRMYIHIAPG